MADERNTLLSEIYDFTTSLGDTITKPGEAVMGLIEKLDKPRGGVAGALVGAKQAMLDGSSIVDGITGGFQRGWDENTSYRELLTDDFQKNHPYLSAGIGLGADVILDPLWLVPPAKVAAGARKAGKVTGITDKIINPAVKALESKKGYQTAKAGLEDVLGRNRLKEAGIETDYNYNMAQDRLEIDDVADSLRDFRKQREDVMELVGKYIEAPERPHSPVASSYTPQMKQDILDSFQNSQIAQDIRAGKYSRENVANILQDSGQEVPDFLLQQKHIDRKLAGDTRPFDGYTYRDDVLAGVEPNLRAAIENVAGKAIDVIQKQSDRLYKAGLIGDAELVRFPNGSHLRRSFEKYETPEDFLEAIRQHGTDAEYKRALEDYQKIGGGLMGNSPLHKIGLKNFRQRQNLSSATMEKMGIIDDAEYRVVDSLSRGSKALNEQAYLAQVAKEFGKDTETAARLNRAGNMPRARQYVQIPDSKEFGELAGMWVERDIHDRVMGKLGYAGDSQGVMKKWENLVNHWKVGKLADFDSIARNFYSGIPMTNVFGQVPMEEMPKYMNQALIAMSKGRQNPAYREFLGSGALDGAQFTKAEMGDILTKPTKIRPSDTVLQKAGKVYGKFEQKGMEYFQKPDEYFRFVTYLYHRGQGKSVKEAGAIARDALLDYGNTPEWVSKAGKTGIVPFARFPFHAGKATARALWEDPAAVAAYYKPQNQVDNDEKKLYPDYVQPGNLLPLWEGERVVDGEKIPVRENLDATFVYPFASDVGLGNAATDLVRMAKDGRDGLGFERIRPGMTNEEKTKEFARYAYDQLAPSIATTTKWEKFINAANGTPDRKGRMYDMKDAALSELAGLKFVPFNLESQMEAKLAGYDKAFSNHEKEIKRIMNDRSLSDDEKERRIADHEREMEGLSNEVDEILDDYDMIEAKKNNRKH